MKPNYYTIKQMIEMIDEPNRTACSRILTENQKLFQMVQGSTNNHQAWLGGYFDHIQEIMNIAVVLYERLNSIRSLPFTVSDALLVTFLHDIEKPWKYEVGLDGQLQYIELLRTKEAQHKFRSHKLDVYGVVLTPEQENGIRYVEGEFNDHTNRQRVMGPLAALCHLADVTSARLWFNHPMEQNDLWSGARRIRD